MQTFKNLWLAHWKTFYQISDFHKYSLRNLDLAAAALAGVVLKVDFDHQIWLEQDICLLL